MAVTMSSSDCSVKVVCRVRPLNEKEKDTSSFVVNFPAENSVGVGVSEVVACMLHGMAWHGRTWTC